MLRHYIGLSEYDLIEKRIETLVFYEPSTLINSHLLICGMSGVGKSHQARQFLASAARSGLEIDVIDAHDELAQIPGAVACIFSQATCYGFNPLVLKTDRHTGGVNRQIEFFIQLIKSVTPQFGVKQESALRYLLVDTYAANGIRQTDPSSWNRMLITDSQRESIIASKNWDELRRYYPTLEDLISFAKRKIIALRTGGDNKCVTAYEQHSRLKSRLHSLQKKFGKAVDDDELKQLSEQIEGQKKKCIESYTSHLSSMETGREIDDVLKYDSVDVLTSILQRLSLLSATGILSANAPPFRGANVRVHQIKSITHEQQVLYTKLRLQAIFEECKRLGPTPTGKELRHIVFLDEAHKFFNNDPDDIINVIAKEARKFGLGLWCASQQPTSFPESFLTNVGATILLGVHTSYWKRLASIFRISEETLKTVKPKEVMAVKFLLEGKVDPPFANVVVPNPVSDVGRIATGAKPTN